MLLVDKRMWVVNRKSLPYCHHQKNRISIDMCRCSVPSYTEAFGSITFRFLNLLQQARLSSLFSWFLRAAVSVCLPLELPQNLFDGLLTWGLTFVFWSEMSQQILDETWWHIPVPLRMNCSNVNIPLTYFVPQSPGQILKVHNIVLGRHFYQEQKIFIDFVYLIC